MVCVSYCALIQDPYSSSLSGTIVIHSKYPWTAIVRERYSAGASRGPYPPALSPLPSALSTDLDLSVTSDTSGSTYYPNGLSKADSLNNVEKVVSYNPTAGDTYTVYVKVS